MTEDDCFGFQGHVGRWLKGLMRRFSLSTGGLDESLLTALGRGDDINRVVIAEESRQQVGHLTL